MNEKFSETVLLALTALCWATSLDAQDSSAGRSASPAAVALDAAPWTGQGLLRESLRQTQRHATIRSRLRTKTVLLDQPLVGSGEYAQLKSSRGLLLRFEMAVQTGGEMSSVKQVCDGRRLWLHWHVGQRESLSFVDLLRVEQALAGTPELVQTPAAATLASGGLPKLLAQLAANFDFSRTPPRATELSDVPAWVVTGVWKLDKLAGIAPESVAGSEIVFAKMPQHLPHQVEVHIGQSQFFPYRVEYQRWTSDGGRMALSPAVTIEFFEVAVGEAMDPTQFDYRPGQMSFTDRTDSYLRGLGVATRTTEAMDER